MRLVVGLGNPGPEYERTRHNAGFMVIERLAARWRIALYEEIRGVRIGAGSVAGVPVRLAEPRQFMNRSGDALVPLAVPADEMVVVHDDIDLAAGQLRVRRAGGTGGHRGLESLVGCFGPDFVRVRIGVGRPPAGMVAADYVLAPMTPPELIELNSTVERGSDAVECVLADGIAPAMNRFNIRLKSPSVESDERIH